MNFLKQLISDGEMPSTMRVLVLIVVVPIMGVWVTLCIKQNTFIVPDLKTVTLVISALGAKTVQSAFESVAPPNANANATTTPTPPENHAN